MSKETYDGLFQEAEADTGISWLLLKAQAMQESRLKPDVVSRRGAQGLAQFMPRTWAEEGIDGDKDGDKDSFSPADAIATQASYMRKLLSLYNYDVLTALAAYNWGMGNIRKHLKRHGHLVRWRLPRETRDYLKKIEKFLAELKQEQKGES